jgi:niacin transporter
MNRPADVDGLRATPQTLPYLGLRALTIQFTMLVAASFLLPAAAHLLGIPVRILLPMHWPVLLIGACYGWRSGAVAGLAAPLLSYFVSGMPYPVMIPSMTVELATYGFLTGYLRQKGQLGVMASVALSILGGRLVFVGTVVLTGAAGGPLASYLQAALLPGLGAAVAQIALLPMISTWWLKREKRVGT